MPLGVREVLLVIRAKDYASRSVEQVGLAFTQLDKQQQMAVARTAQMGRSFLGLGAVLGVMGASGVAAFGGMVKAASDYNKEASLTLTQTEKGTTSLKEIEKVGLDVAKAIPAPFKEMQGALFDIFSSMDVNVSQAEDILTGFSKAAVAGNVTLKEAGRAAISELNAFKSQGYDLNQVLDLQFQLVRKGVGTYGEFAAVLGRIIPAAVATGQSIETMNGFLAFATRNGLSAAMAATGTARAFEALANPKVVERLKATFDVDVVDKGTGAYRQFGDVVADLGKKMANMTQPQRFAALNELLKGAGGTIQARRVLQLAITDFETLQKRIDEQRHAVGALADAYDTMAKSPAAAGQLIKNQLDAIKVELGNALIPVFIQGAKHTQALLKAFDELSSHTKALIAQVGLAASAFLLIAGLATAAAGAFLVLAAAFGGSAVAAGAFLAALALIPVAIYAVIKNSEELSQTVEPLWETLKSIGETVASQFGNMEDIGKNVVNVFADLVEIVGAVVSAFAPLAGIIAGIGFVALINTLKILTGVLSAVTGFLADHKEIVIALAAIYISTLIPALVAAAQAFAALILDKIAFFFFNMAGAVDKLVASLTLANVELAALAVGVVLVIKAFNDHQNAAAKLRDELQGHPKTLKAYWEANQRLIQTQKDLSTHLNEGGGALRIWGTNLSLYGTTTARKAGDTMAALSKQVDDNNKVMTHAKDVIGAVTTATGMNEDSVQNLADKMGVNLFDANANVIDQQMKLINAFKKAQDQTGLSADALKEYADGSGKSVEEIGDAVQKFTEKIAKAFAKDTDIISAANSVWQDKLKAMQTAAQNVASAQKKVVDDQTSDRKRAIDDAADQRKRDIDDAAQAQKDVEGITKAQTRAIEKAADDQKRAIDKSADEQKRAIDKSTDAQKEAIDKTVKAQDELGKKVVLSFDDVKKAYDQILGDAKSFSTNIDTAIKMGLDPGVITKLLEQGPKDAGPLLQAIVNDHSGRLVNLVNDSEKALAEINDKVIESARIMYLATNAPTQQMAQDAKAAMKIVMDQNANGIASYQEYANRTGLSLADVKRVVGEYGLLVTDTTNKVGGLRDEAGKPIGMDVGPAITALQSLDTAIGVTGDNLNKGATAINNMVRGQFGLDPYTYDLPQIGPGGSVINARIFAAGGVLKAANGMIASSPTVLFGERGTGSEAYIPKMGISKGRAMGLLGTAAGWYNARVTPMASGGIMSMGTPTPMSGSVTINGPIFEFSGPIDSATLPKVDAMMDEKLRELYNMIQQGVGERT